MPRLCPTWGRLGGGTLTNMKPSLLKYLFIKADYELFEALSAFTLLLFGVGLLNPGNDNTWTAPAYKYLAQICTQVEFGVILVIAGGLGLIALKIGGLKCRLTVTFIKTFIWMFVFTVIAIADPPRTVSPFIFGYVIFNFVLLGRQWSDYSLGKPTWMDK